ncbi:MAG: hypothetical protein WAM14_00560 [Candidatus Nitrosopolaris sp.]
MNTTDFDTYFEARFREKWVHNRYIYRPVSCIGLFDMVVLDKGMSKVNSVDLLKKFKKIDDKVRIGISPSGMY